MKSKNTRRIGEVMPMKSPLELLASGELPEWTAEAWRHNCGIDPRSGIKLVDAFYSYAVPVFFIIFAVPIVAIQAHLFGKEASNFVEILRHIPIWLCVIVMALGFLGLVFHRDLWSKMDEKYGRGFNWAFHWLFAVHPMTPQEFPKDVEGLKILWLELIAELAMLVEANEESEDKYAAGTARTELRMLVKGARWIGFLKAGKGVGIAFRMAKGRTNYETLRAMDWFKRMNARRQSNSGMIGVARAIRPIPSHN